MYLCFADLVDHIIQYAGSNPAAQTVLNARGAAQTALRVLSTGAEWQYYNTVCDVNVDGPYSTGTIQYTNSTRAVTLTGGTWPTWAAYGYLVMANATYSVISRDSATQLTLDPNSTPGDDIAALTPYNLRRDTFPLPSDFGSATSAVAQPGAFPMRYVTDATVLTGRNYNIGTGRPTYFAVTADPQSPQRLAMRTWPSPNSVYHIQLSYRRKMLTPIYMRSSPGLVSCTASSATITGNTSTAFNSAQIGAAIRLSNDAKTLPTGTYGDNPAEAEFVISAVGGANTLTATSTAIETLTNVKYVITSLLDVEPESMLEYLLREAERQYRLIARMKNTAEEIQARAEAYQRAREADMRYTGRQSAGPALRAGVFDFVNYIPTM